MKKEVNTEELQNEDIEKMFVKTLRFQRIININMVRFFFAVLASVSLLGLVPFLRPEFSVTEKRELHKFPKFSFSALFSGDYFDNIGLWYSDTFPVRDGFVAVNTKLNDMFGIGGVEIHGDVVEANAVPAKAEEITPDVPETVPAEPEAAPVEPEQPQLEIEKIGAMAIVDNVGYEYYNFENESADLYAAAISRAADTLAGKCRVFNTIVPTSVAITLDESIAARMSISDQKAAIDYMYSRMSPNTICVDSYSILKEHSGEYLYFRTDHHWTANAAYYSYTKLMEAAGSVPAQLAAFNEFVFEGFLGTFYTTSNMSSKLAATPDTVYAYGPQGIEFIHTYEVGYEKDYHIVSDVNKLSASEKYLAFICGDHPLGVITNDQIADNSACLIFKESFGNPIVAYFTQNYHTVYVADCRKLYQVYPGTLDSFVTERGIGDVFFINNISATRSKRISRYITDFIGQ